MRMPVTWPGASPRPPSTNNHDVSARKSRYSSLISSASSNSIACDYGASAAPAMSSCWRRLHRTCDEWLAGWERDHLKPWLHLRYDEHRASNHRIKRQKLLNPASNRSRRVTRNNRAAHLAFDHDYFNGIGRYLARGPPPLTPQAAAPPGREARSACSSRCLSAITFWA